MFLLRNTIPYLQLDILKELSYHLMSCVCLGRSSGKASPMRHLDRQADRSSPVISEPRDEVTSSASDDSGED